LRKEKEDGLEWCKVAINLKEYRPELTDFSTSVNEASASKYRII